MLLISAAVAIAGCYGGGGSAPAPSTVKTTRDAKGVWFITGSEQETLYNVFEAMGYAVATDRLFQAETFRRAARGRLAEILGSSQLEQDKLARITGYSDLELQKGFNEMDGESQEVVKGYIAGFNRRIAEIRSNPSLLPFEFSALGMTGAALENWTYQDVMACGAMMMRKFDPEGLNQGQIENAALYQELVDHYGSVQGAKMFEDLRWINDPDALTYIPKPLAAAGAGARQISMPQTLPLIANPPTFPDLRDVSKNMAERQTHIDANLKKINAYIKMGSYAWVVGGTKTASGNPMIYSGPQMGFSVPTVVGEGSIRAGGLNISGMHVAGLPAMIIGRTPHHAWTMQVGHAHSADYYLEDAAQKILHRTEIIKVKGGDDVALPVYRTVHGPVINEKPVISWKYAHWKYESQAIKAYLDLARAASMDEFGAAIELVPVSQHFLYADRDGNIAFWMSGRDPVRPYGEWRLPQGATGAALEWDPEKLIPRATDRNTSQGYYCGWNNKANAGYNSPPNAPFYVMGVAHRADVINDYLRAGKSLTFEQVRDLALNIAATDSIGDGGNPWNFVSSEFTAAVNSAPDAPVAARTAALNLLASWDGHFVEGGAGAWAAGKNRADAWMLMDAWIKEVLKLTFEELDAAPAAKSKPVLFNVLLHDLKKGGIDNYYNWFQNLSDPAAPQTANAIIVKALDNTLASLGARPWGTNERGVITFSYMGIKIWEMPFSSRSTYAQVIEYGKSGPVRLQTMFPLGESGTILKNESGAPVLDSNFLSMTGVFDEFIYRDFPLFQ